MRMPLSEAPFEAGADADEDLDLPWSRDTGGDREPQKG